MHGRAAQHAGEQRKIPVACAVARHAMAHLVESADRGKLPP